MLEGFLLDLIRSQKFNSMHLGLLRDLTDIFISRVCWVNEICDSKFLSCMGIIIAHKMAVIRSLRSAFYYTHFYGI